MTIKVAINGYGRIGRALLRIISQNPQYQDLELVAINDLGDAQTLAHLTRYDSTFGPLHAELSEHDGHWRIGQQHITLLAEKDPSKLPWQALGVDLVLECSGKFKQRQQAAAHLLAGAKRVLASHPMDDADLTLVYGVNHQALTGAMQVVSNASCTTNCLAPVAHVLDQLCGIESGLITTVHAYTNDQNLLDKTHSDLYRARAAALSMIPSKTGAAKAVGLVLPHLNGKLDGLAVRVPTPNVSLVDLVAQVRTPLDKEALHHGFSQAAAAMPHGVLAVNDLPLVSVDFNGNPHSATLDSGQTRVQGHLIKLMAWYDNEWGFAHRMLDVVQHWQTV
ncbi:type I glyceraldehyde-3-phosphate dehydrogenase [Atopomonas sediminilitoris]|uniref:type I glyceraldehyde-3-phosphate dehydrogenase n=1 Tax=Atopomonas sediminilitoris TaxID=2919919 RepID=UPI001F4DDBA3|nr:type I glyceraldehyde-3-phosphate dehydrogenase [Atopomonas sediminilitoris]MCJ8168767.1 type I glyceraldehyde-3-phosphate dehydrogenase [Atopomonas sediminilitoris]